MHRTPSELRLRALTWRASLAIGILMWAGVGAWLLS